MLAKRSINVVITLLLVRVKLFVTNSLLAYYFQYVLHANYYWLVGAITAVLGIISVSLFPALVAFIKRRAIYVGGIVMMLIGYAIFLLAGHNVIAVLIAVGIFFFPYPMIFLAALMTITDSVEYGQLKNGTRNESVTLSVRPLLDKVAGAIANSVVGLAAVHSGTIGNAKPSSISAGQLLNFSYMFSHQLIIIAALVYLFKVKLSEATSQSLLN